MAKTLLELRELDAGYGSVQVLHNVSIKVRTGEVVALLGGNASGKSSTIKSVFGLTTFRRGSIRFGSKELTGLSTNRIVDLGIGSIPEGRRLFSTMSVRENLLMGAYSRRREPMSHVQNDIDAVLAYFPVLSERLQQMAGSLSGGEQQMLAMGRAWIRRPRLLCIDEPSMGLSPLFVERVYAILRRWKNEGMTILLVDQNANLALQLADRAYVFQNGKIVIAGTGRNLIENPAVARAYLGGGI